MIKDIFGTYNMRCRINVGLIFLSPILVHIYLLLPEFNSLASTFIITLIIYALSSLIVIFSRQYGSKALMKCYPDMLPAQQFLMPNDTHIDTYTKDRYYDFFRRHIPNFSVSEDINDMKLQVQTAITWLISQTKDTSKYSLINEENMNLGFSYNLLGLKPFAIWLCIILVSTDFCVMGVCYYFNFHQNTTNMIYSILFTLLCLIMWCSMITEKLVISSAQKYARALLSACDSPFLN